MNFIIISILSILSISFYRSNYNKGLFFNLFLLILLPPNLSIQFGPVFPTISIHRALIVIMFIFWLSNDIEKKIGHNKVFRVLVAISICSFISAFLSPSLLISIKQYIYFLLENVCIFVIFATSLKTKEEMEKTILVMITSLLIVAIIGIFEKYSGFNPSDLFGEVNDYYGLTSSFPVSTRDVISTYSHRILFGYGMSIGAILTLFFIRNWSNFPKNMFYWILIAIFCSALYFSQSRGPWLAFIITITMSVILDIKFIFKKAIIIIIMMSIIFFMKPGTLDTIQELYESTMNTQTVKGSSFQWRFQVLDSVLSKISESEMIYKFLGYGGGSRFMLEWGELESSSGHAAQLESFDCDFAITVLEFGILGIFLQFVLYCYFFLEAIKCGNKNKNTKILMGAVINGIFIFIFAKTNVSIYAPQLNYIEFVFLAIGSTCYINEINKDKGFYNGIR